MHERGERPVKKDYIAQIALSISVGGILVALVVA
jgi:hypothetical protein